MFEQHFALRENPFVAGHQSRFVYPSPDHQEALAHLRYGIENREPFVLITGEVGTGKTTALFEVLEEYKARAVVAVVTNSALSRTELLEEIGLRLGFTPPPVSSKPQLLAQLERHLLVLRSKGDRAILLLDEAQNLDRELLEEIRLLSNLEAQGEKLLQVFLLGQPELEERLTKTELRQLRQRIAVHYRLNPLSAADTQRYIHHRIAVAGGYGPKIFDDAAAAEVYALSHGIPREINQLCAQALLNAFVEDAPVVRPEHVRAAAREIEFESVLRGKGEAAPSRTATPPTAEPAPSPAPPAAASDADRTEELPLASAVEHSPAPNVAPATDEVNWEAWVRSLMTAPAGPETGSKVAAPPARPVEPTPPPPPPRAAAPAPVTEPERPAPTLVKKVTPTPAPPPAERELEPARGPEPTPARTHDRTARELASALRVAAERAAPAPAAPRSHEETWRPPMWTPEHGNRKARAVERPTRRREADDDPGDPSRAAIRWMSAVLVLAVLVIGGVLLFRFGPFGKQPASSSTHAAVGEAASPVPTPEPAPVPADSTPAASGTNSAPPVSVAPTPAPAPARPAPTPAQKPVSTPSTYGLVVGTFIDEGRAEAESRRLGADSGLRVRVRAIPDEGATLYEIVLGSFPNRVKAEQAAGDLIARGVVNEARVVTQRR